MAFRNEDDKKAYWRENLALMAKLLVVFVALIFIYMYKMNQLDKRYGVDEE